MPHLRRPPHRRPPDASAGAGRANPQDPHRGRAARRGQRDQHPGDSDATPSTFKITASGSYHLTANISLVNARSGIEITASGVTLDLNGFTISGFGGVAGIIVTNSPAERVVVRSGRIINFLNGGIDANVSNVEIDRVAVVTCGERGIRAGPRARITDCSVIHCHIGATGISAGADSIIDRCTVSGNAASGIVAQPGTIVTSSTASESANDGFVTTFSFPHVGAIFEGCAARANDRYGFHVNLSVVRGCTAAQNTSSGIYAVDSCSVIDNYCTGNAIGSTTRGNISAQDGQNRIEGNMCLAGGIGIHGTSFGNFFARNVCANNTLNWQIPAGNKCLVVNGVNAGAISGNSGGTSPGSTDPNAKLAY